MRAPENALINRLEAAATEYLLQRYSGPGNPMGTEICRMGDAIATKVAFAPATRIMNTVHHLSDPEHLSALLEFYARTGQRCWIDVSPARSGSDLTAAMVHAGFRPERYRTLLYGAVAALPSVRAPAAGIEIRQIGSGDLGTFLDVLNRGFDVPEAGLANLRRNQSFWADVPSWRLYLGFVDGVMAGAAVLSLHDSDGERIGCLAAGATLEGTRGRGLHSALLAARLRDAALAGCDYVTGQADFGSVSQRNQQRAGLAIGNVITVWSNGG